MKLASKCVHAGYTPANGGADALPIYQSTTFRYDSTDHVGDLFDLKDSGPFYTRLSNPTVDAVETKIAELEGGVGALCSSSGMSATLLAVMNIVHAGEHVVSTATIYGGTVNLFSVTFKKFGIDVTFVDADAPDEEIQKAFRPNTRLLFGETIANPSIAVLDIERLANLAHKNGVPFMVDNTFATPALCRPFEFGADIVVHSTSKYMDGHGVQLGGVIVDSGNFPWDNGNYPEFTVPDESYHGLVYTQAFGRQAYIVKARAQMIRDLGTAMTPMAAFLLNLGLETLPLRMKKHCENAEKVAEYLAGRSDKIEFVNYPTLPGDKYHDLAEKYLPEGKSGVIAFSVKGGRERAAAFIDHLKMISLLVHVADIRTCVLHPASSTHRQLTDEQLRACGITPGLIRLSCGVEDVEDILEDIEQALEKV